MKRIALLALAAMLSLGGTVYFGNTRQPITAAERIEEIKTIELPTQADERARARTGKYKFKKAADYEVHEYVTPKGETGYHILYSTKEAAYSIGYGPEAAERTYTIIYPTASTTP